MHCGASLTAARAISHLASAMPTRIHPLFSRLPAWPLALGAALCLASAAHAQTVTEGSDHATQVLGKAWDMSSQEDVFPLLWTHNLASATVAGGVMTATARDTDPHFWLQFPPIPSAMEAINLARQPIDANRYTHLSFMMWLPDSVVPGARNGRLVWHKGGATVAEFDAAYSESPMFPVYPGWHLYQFNLATLQAQVGTPWSGPIHGLRIDPCLGCNVQFKIDWARLHHHSEAGARTPLPPGKTHLLARIQPPDGSPAITTVLPQVQGQASAAALPPGSYQVAAIDDGNYALSQRGKAWTFDTPNDLLWAANHGLSAAHTGPNGLSASTSNPDPYVLLDIAQHSPIDAGQYRYLSVDLTIAQLPAQESGLLVWWGDQPATVRHPSEFIRTSAGRATYTIDLGRSPQWRGIVRALRIDPLNGPNAGANVPFTLHGVHLSKTPGAAAAPVFATQPLLVNASPQVQILSPGLGQGDDYALVEQGRAWNMLPGQVRAPELSNLQGWTYTHEVPDLGLQGSFFVGQSRAAAPGQTEGDPHIFLAYQENTKPINADTYRWLGFDLYVPMDAANQDELTRGAMARVAWKRDDFDPGLTSDDIVLMPGMQRYWVDMKNLPYEPASTRTWSGMARYLRIDPLEFPESRLFFAGPAQLRSTPAARSLLPVSVQLHDIDGDAMQVVVRSGETELGRATGLTSGTHQILASVAALPEGEHSITVEVSDGRSISVRKADVPVLKLAANTPPLPHQTRAADRVFNWAERELHELLGTGTASSSGHACLQGVPGAWGRFYPQANLCLYTADSQMFLLVIGQPPSLVGSLSEWLELVAALGF